MIRHGKCKMGITFLLLFLFSLSGGIHIQAKQSGEDNLLKLRSYLLRAVEWSKEQNGQESLAPFFGEEMLQNAASGTADWYAIGIGRMGISEGQEAYFPALQEKVEDMIGNKEEREKLLPTDWSRMLLAAQSVGEMKSERISIVRKLLLKNPVYHSDMSENMSANQYIWSLIAFNTVKEKEFDDEKKLSEVKQALVEKILSYQKPDGGFVLEADEVNIDIAGMALQALAPYALKEEVKQRIDRTVHWLSDCQGVDGDFSQNGGTDDSGTIESTVQVIIGLCALDINPAGDKRFIKGNNSLFDGLLKYRTGDGGFAHTVTRKDNRLSYEGEGNAMSTSQAICAMTALYRYSTGLSSLYEVEKENSGKKASERENIFQVKTIKNPLIMNSERKSETSLGEKQKSKTQQQVIAKAKQRKQWEIAGGITLFFVLGGVGCICYLIKKERDDVK